MKRFFTQPHTLFVFFALFFGLILVFLQPTGAGYDEEAHLARIYEISTGHPIPNTYLLDGGLPDSFNRISYRQEKFLLPIDRATIQKNFTETIHDPLRIGYRIRASYSPVNYIFQAVIMLVFGWGLNFPLPIIYYMIRLSYLIIFTLLGYFTIKFIPFGKWILFVLMLAPTTALQFATITADAITFGVSFLFIGWSLHLVINKVTINRKVLWISFLLVFLLASVKVNSIPLVLLFLLLKPSQFTSRKSRGWFWITVILLLGITAGGWNLIALKSGAVKLASANGSSGIESLLTSLKSPLTLLTGFFTYFISNLGYVMTGWLAVYGYNYWTVPGIVFILFPVGLLFSFIHDLGDKKLPSSIRWGLLGLFLLLFFGTFALRFIPKQLMGGDATIQGRYVVVAIPLLFLGLTAWGRPLPLSKWFVPLAVTFLSLSLAFYLWGMGVSYYQLCGENTYNGKECLLPVYKNWGPSKNDMVPLPGNGTIQQSVVFDCNKVDMMKIQVLNLDLENATGSFKLSLVDPEKDQAVAEETFSIQDVPENGSVQIDFPAIDSIVNREFFIRIDDISTTNESLGIPITDPGEYRNPDSFSINGVVQDKDILFHYRCVK